MVRRVYASVYEASGTMRPRNTAYPDWRNVIGPTKNGAETPGPHYTGPVYEFSLRVAQSVLVGLRGLSGLTLISVVTIRIFYSKRPCKPTISENHEITRRNDIICKVTTWSLVTMILKRRLTLLPLFMDSLTTRSRLFLK